MLDICTGIYAQNNEELKRMYEEDQNGRKVEKID